MCCSDRAPRQVPVQRPGRAPPRPRIPRRNRGMLRLNWPLTPLVRGSRCQVLANVRQPCRPFLGGAHMAPISARTGSIAVSLSDLVKLRTLRVFGIQALSVYDSELRFTDSFGNWSAELR